MRSRPDRGGSGAAASAAGPAGVPAPRATRREDTIVVAGTIGLGLLGLLILLGVGLNKVLFGILVVGAAVLSLLQPEIGLYALILNALLGFTHMASLPRVGPLSLPMAFEVVLVAAVLGGAIFRGRRLFVAAPQHLLLLGLTAWMVVSLLANGGVAPANLDAIRNLFLVRMVVFFLLTNIATSGAALKRLLVVLIVSNAGLLLSSYLVRLGVFGAERLSYSERILRTSGVVHNPNTLAFDLITLLILSFGAFLYVRHPIGKAALAVLMGLDVLAILTTLSRSGFVALCAVLLVMLWKLKGSWKALLALVVLGTLVYLFVPWGLEYRFGLVEGMQEVDRVKFAQVGLAMFLDNPVFGVGFGNYIENFPRYNATDLRDPQPTHNLYLDLAAQAGLPALILYVSVIAVTWRRLLLMESDIRRRGWQRSFPWSTGIAVQVCLANILVFGLSGHVEFEYSVFIVLGLGMLVYREHWKRVETGAGGAPRRRHAGRGREGGVEGDATGGTDGAGDAPGTSPAR